jgi:hypothetical protein
MRSDSLANFLPVFAVGAHSLDESVLLLLLPDVDRLLAPEGLEDLFDEFGMWHHSFRCRAGLVVEIVRVFSDLAPCFGAELLRNLRVVFSVAFGTFNEFLKLCRCPAHTLAHLLDLVQFLLISLLLVVIVAGEHKVIIFDIFCCLPLTWLKARDEIEVILLVHVFRIIIVRRRFVRHSVICSCL